MSSSEAFEFQSELREIFRKPVGAVRGLLGFEGNGEEFFGGVGHRVGFSADLDYVLKLDEIKFIESLLVIISEKFCQVCITGAVCDGRIGFRLADGTFSA